MNTQSKRLGLISLSLLAVILALNFTHFHTQSEGALARVPKYALKLIKGNETASIMSGQWVVAVSADNFKVLARGEYLGLDVTDTLAGPALHILDADKTQIVPVADIKTLYRGRAREMGLRMGQGALLGAGIGAVIGGIIGSDSYFGDTAGIMLLCAAIDGAALAAAGGGVGLLMQLTTKKYALGPEAWTIVIPEAPQESETPPALEP